MDATLLTDEHAKHLTWTRPTPALLAVVFIIAWALVSTSARFLDCRWHIGYNVGPATDLGMSSPEVLANDLHLLEQAIQDCHRQLAGVQQEVVQKKNTMQTEIEETKHVNLHKFSELQRELEHAQVRIENQIRHLEVAQQNSSDTVDDIALKFQALQERSRAANDLERQLAHEKEVNAVLVRNLSDLQHSCSRRIDSLVAETLSLHRQVADARQANRFLQRKVGTIDQKVAVTIPAHFGPNPEDITLMPEPQFIVDNHRRAYVLQTQATWTQFVDWDHKKPGLVSAKIRCPGDHPPDVAYVYLAVKCFDSMKVEISDLEMNRIGPPATVLTVDGRVLTLDCKIASSWAGDGPCHERSLLVFADGATDRRADRTLSNVEVQRLLGVKVDYRSENLSHGAYSRVEEERIYLNMDPPLDIITPGITKVWNVRGDSPYILTGKQHPSELIDWTTLEATIKPDTLRKWTRYIKFGIIFEGALPHDDTDLIPRCFLNRISIEQT